MPLGGRIGIFVVAEVLFNTERLRGVVVLHAWCWRVDTKARTLSLIDNSAHIQALNRCLYIPLATQIMSC